MRRIAHRDRPYERNMDPDYIRELTSAYEAWLSNLQDIPVLIINTNNLDFLASDDDLEHVAAMIREALLAQGNGQPTAYEARNALLNGGGIPAFQEFHRQLDASKGFDPDLFFNYILLMEEAGEVASELVKIWGDTKQLAADGSRTPAAAHQEAINRHRASLRSELADLLAYTLKIANYTGIDLEQAYLDKMKQNLGRDWPKERTLLE
jgi:NTP pyrophosphatase (non-canonical NTP hydrolase)